MEVIDITKQVGKTLDNAGFGNDSNESKDIKQAGIWDLLDALSRKDNSKFSRSEAKKELAQRGV